MPLSKIWHVILPLISKLGCSPISLKHTPLLIGIIIIIPIVSTKATYDSDSDIKKEKQTGVNIKANDIRY
jgi:hypothetical protein